MLAPEPHIFDPAILDLRPYMTLHPNLNRVLAAFAGSCGASLRRPYGSGRVPDVLDQAGGSWCTGCKAFWLGAKGLKVDNNNNDYYYNHITITVIVCVT